MKKISILFFFLISFIELLNAQYNKLLDFTDTTNGSYPYDTFISDGIYLYGMAHMGGANGLGTLFKLKPDGSGFVKLLDFDGSTNGSIPRGSLFYDGIFLYGMTENGGIYNKGTIFKIKPDGSGYTKLLDFAGATNGSNPGGTLISDGIFLYGTTTSGGINSKGTVFKIKPDGSGYTKLLDFSGITNGSNPYGSLIHDGTYLYGMTVTGGITTIFPSSGDGTIFKIKTDGSGFIKLLDFSSAITGDSPFGSLISDSTFLYGMTRQGGTYSQGTIFKIKLDGSGYTKLLDFDGTTNGCVPTGSLIFVGSFMYGMTWGCGISNYGTIFKIKPDGSNYTQLWDFINVIDGRNPYSTLFPVNSFLYGMTYSGGINNKGVVFKIDTITLGIKENNKNDSIAIYPNPASDNFTIKVPQKSTIEILNINGQIIKTIIYDSGATLVDIRVLLCGVYIIKIKTDKEIVTKKFIKK